MTFSLSITTLSKAAPDRLLRVSRLEGDEATNKRLREIGLRESAELRLVSRGGQFICSVCGTRLALSKQLAERIWIEPFASNFASAPLAIAS
jgi:Fe2+ transport system protein FeoA